jgi:hypothetical protein
MRKKQGDFPNGNIATWKKTPSIKMRGQLNGIIHNLLEEYANLSNNLPWEMKIERGYNSFTFGTESCRRLFLNGTLTLTLKINGGIKNRRI